MPNVAFDLECTSPVAIGVGPADYDATPPFSPGRAYPEYSFCPAPHPNHAYETVRETLRLLGLDAARFGTPEWDPLACVVVPGDMVVLKPNFVRDFRETHPDPADCLTTHGTVLRAVIDYVYKALDGKGRIIIADAPQNDCDFEAVCRQAGLAEIQRFYRERAGFNIEVYDLRPEKADKIDGVIVGHSRLPGDPAGYVKINLGRHSAFYEINHLCHLLYGSEYDMSELRRHQSGDVHEYLISRTVLSADVVISLPKLKAHKKTGLTVNMKNLVGINGNKNWLPHHREGTPLEGGDQFADSRWVRRLERRVVERFKRAFPLLGPIRPLVAGPVKGLGKRVFGDTNRDTIRSGNWYGNDTTWRMCLDLNRILVYADAEGNWQDAPARRFFSLVDGIIAGEGTGPLDPPPRPAGVILAGFNPVAVDLVAARLMGFDYQKIPLLRCALENHPLTLADFSAQDVEVVSNHEGYHGSLGGIDGSLGFQPHFGWKGHIELETRGVHLERSTV
ncbi:MAG: DUF362 domain-containing protein [Phycisphaerae bacterium]|nr:DUF362 domain-containing protein [Phycisphaerae bacterium]